MGDETPLKPQETVIYLLGTLTGKVDALQGGMNATEKAQNAVNEENKREHAHFRITLESHALDINSIKAAQPLKVSPWAKAAVIIAVPASLVALVGFLFAYFSQQP